ncbi:MAG: RpiB/LacA/LacB family sugar-phosphate isomerase, partial [Bdellovibrionales bacterium]|nr:RpiB/LacA/LacB family sugar-phosphate isomerase [Bdellovibrionales bacterium]
MPQKIFLGCDHGGFPLKQKILSHFTEMEFVDFGTNSDDS